ncbi:MAG: DNA-processing protein DprA [Planctomycetota bacterium]|nr:DNA-processing protein DprA [Planctomycetota bacterium]
MLTDERKSKEATLIKQDWLRLNMVRGLGPRIQQALLGQFQTPENIFAATHEELRSVEGVGPQLASAIRGSNHRLEAIAELQHCYQQGIDILPFSETGYPKPLKQIPDPPGVLYARGSIRDADSIAVAIVGTRHASRYGLGQAEKFASGLARAGFTIISGLARGIDTVAHEAALAAGGRTLAVLGSGLLQLYPPENRDLAERISQHGAVLTENALDHRPSRSSFPRRNRIVTGLALGLVVIEAAKRSGALISAQHAMEQNREVMVLPGRVDSRSSAGCHELIRDGARLVTQVDQVLEEFGPLAEISTDIHGHKVHHPAELQLNRQERSILDAVDEQVVSIETLVQNTGLSVSRVLSTISVLEMKRLLTRVSGTQVARS